MRILIFGKTGQVGRELARAPWPEHWSVELLGRAECDLLNRDSIAGVIHTARPHIVINGAAFTAVDRAQAEPETAEKVNCDAPAAMAAACRNVGSALIHLSTDYVFDGSKSGAYLENDPVGPRSVYGRTKAEGERAVAQALPQHVIIRTSWVFAAHGTNFVRTILRLSHERPELRIVEDQKGAPTAATDIATAIATIARRITDGEKDAWGTFHFTGAEPTTWLGFAQAILGLSGRHTRLVPIATADYRTAAQRPLNSVLDCGRIAREYGILQPSWRLSLEDVLTEIDDMAEPAGRRNQ
ncbi:MAG TPA: dTDP-4-dehydrorhamnose reductase [Rhizomicrobium sp.]|jgi:dTDP-4-dehydrorhamnose reductase|nr:dTDP-4-dehydrorhamnose reductase [Rhizomicrobium sp.]